MSGKKATVETEHVLGRSPVAGDPGRVPAFPAGIVSDTAENPATARPTGLSRGAGLATPAVYTSYRDVNHIC